MTTSEAPSSAPGAGDAPEPMYLELADWVTDHFVPVFRRTLGGEYRWCAEWWRHDEAVSRLKALWHAWEVLRLAARDRHRHLVPRASRPPAADPDGRPRPVLPVQRNRAPRTPRSRRAAGARRAA